MGFKLPAKWVWDFWFAIDGDRIHMFYLQADRSLEDPELRHWHASIEHAVTTDLVHWETRPAALLPAAEFEAPDSLTTWTGSVLHHQGLWHLFYTGTSRAEEGKIQRICLATSTDLDHWRRSVPSEVVALDPAWYEELDLACWYDQSWRDPWVIPDPETGRFHMFMTCRVGYGAADGRGAIGHAQSDDLKHWQVGPPVMAPGWFGEMEVPQVERIGDYWYLFCSVSARFHNRAACDALPPPARTGTIYFIAERPAGPYRVPADPYLVADEPGSLYAGRILRLPSGEWIYMAFRNRGTDGNFIGDLGEPMRLVQLADGRLQVIPR